MGSDARPAAAATDKEAKFPKVFSEELADIERRRNLGAPARGYGGTGGSGGSAEDERELRREALDKDIVGLALSGGGIRSATFCLGVLQGLAELGLLGRFDYLSTVSGGGYIGGWLAAWIKREGDVANVEKQLKPNRIEQSAARRIDGANPVGGVFDKEPEPIRHLRAYSNYLAPRPSPFSADGWVLIAIYLRNLLLNQFVFFLLSLALVAGVATLVQLAAITAYGPDLQALNQANAQGQYVLPDDQREAEATGSVVWEGGRTTETGALRTWPYYYLLFYPLIGVLMLVACYGVYRSVGQIAEAEAGAEPRDSPGRIRTEKRGFQLLILLPLVLAAFVGCLFSLYHFGPLPTGGWEDLSDRGWDVVAVAGFFGLMHGILQVPSLDLRRVFASRSRGGNPGQSAADPAAWQIAAYLFRIVLAGILGAGGGLLFYFAVFGLHAAAGENYWVPTLVTLCPPLLLALFVLVGFIQTGVLGECLTEAQREWRSSLGGYLLALAVGWLVLFGTVLYGPWLWYTLLSPSMAGTWGATILSAVWSALVGGGVLAAWSPLTGPDKTASGAGSWWLGALAKAAPPLFLGGVLVLAVVLTTSLVWGFHGGKGYLDRIDSANFEGFGLEEHPPSLPCSWVKLGALALASSASFGLALLLSRRFNINIFSLNGLYANRLVRCYLGASRPKRPGSTGKRRPGAPTNVLGPPRNPNAVTGFDPGDDRKLSEFQTPRTPAPPDRTRRTRRTRRRRRRRRTRITGAPSRSSAPRSTWCMGRSWPGRSGRPSLSCSRPGSAAVRPRATGKPKNTRGGFPSATPCPFRAPPSARTGASIRRRR